MYSLLYSLMMYLILFQTGGGKGGRTYIKYGRPGAQIGLTQSSTIDIGKEVLYPIKRNMNKVLIQSYMESFNEMTGPSAPLMAPTAFGRSGNLFLTI